MILQCEGMISEEECFTVLQEFKVSKTPGTDGLSAEFYKYFWPELGSDMTIYEPKRSIKSLIPKTSFPGSLLFTLPGARRGETLGTRLRLKTKDPSPASPHSTAIIKS